MKAAMTSKTQKKTAKNQSNLFIIAVGVLLGAFLVGGYLYTSSQSGKAAAADPALMATLVRPHAMSFGPADAPVVIVEFFDPACETCAAFYPMVKQMMAANPDKIRLVMRYAPFHQGSGAVVAAIEAARRQGKHEPALEALLRSQHSWAPNHTAQMDLAWQYLEGLGLDFARMRQDMSLPEISQIISQDVADLRALGVSKTPEFFVNGKPLPRFGFGELKALVDEALREAR
jgi:protein-disulfide isomerase